MKTVAKFPGLMRRGSRFFLRVHVPKDLWPLLKRREVVTALGTSDAREAAQLAKIRKGEFERQFTDQRQAVNDVHVDRETPSPPTLRTLTFRERQALADLHHVNRVSDEPFRRSTFLTKARVDKLAFWNGEIVPIPDDECALNGHRFSLWHDRLAVDDATKLETALLYAIDFHHKTLVRDLEAKFAVGDCGDFLDLADKTTPNLTPDDRIKLALGLMAAELRALQDIAANDDRRVREITKDLNPGPSTNASIGVHSVTTLLAVDDKSNPRLSKARAEWLKEKTSSDLSTEYLASCQSAVELLIDIVGDKPIAAYGKTDAREFKTVVSSLPPNRKKLKATRDLSVHEAVKEAARLGMTLMDAKTVNKRISGLFNLFTWLQDNYDSVTANPFDGVTIATKSDPREDKDPFSLDELKAIFTAPMFTGCRSEHDWRTPGNTSLRGKAIYWLPILGLYTGARANELCKLKVTDIRQEGEIWYFDINREPHSDPKIVPKLKSRASARRIPIHADLIAFGFLDHVNARRADGAERLFPELVPNVNGKLQDAPGKHFKRLLESLGIKHDRIDFHSFRHTWVDACANSSISDSVTLRLKGESLPGTLKRYGSGKADLELLADGMTKLRFKGLDLDHLKVAVDA